MWSYMHFGTPFQITSAPASSISNLIIHVKTLKTITYSGTLLFLTLICRFLCSLLYWNVFDECVLGHLDPGHTHEDIDQLFSKISHNMTKGPLRSPAALQQVIFSQSLFRS